MKGAVLWITSTIIIKTTIIMGMITAITIMATARNAVAATTKRLKTWWCAMPSAA